MDTLQLRYASFAILFDGGGSGSVVSSITTDLVVRKVSLERRNCLSTGST